MSMFSDFLTEHGFSTEAVVLASHKVETHSPEARATLVQRAAARRDKKKYEELSLNKPGTLGRGVTDDVAKRALAGSALPRLARRKLVRAVNELLASAKKDPVEWRQLFADAPVKKGKKK